MRLFWSDLIVSVRNCPATICGGGRGMAGVLQPATTCSNSSRDRPNTPAASLLLLRIPLAPLLSHVLVSTPTNVAGRSPSNDQVRHKTPGHTRRRPHSRGAAPVRIATRPARGPAGTRPRTARTPRARTRPAQREIDGPVRSIFAVVTVTRRVSANAVPWTGGAGGGLGAPTWQHSDRSQPSRNPVPVQRSMPPGFRTPGFRPPGAVPVGHPALRHQPSRTTVSFTTRHLFGRRRRDLPAPRRRARRG